MAVVVVAAVAAVAAAAVVVAVAVVVAAAEAEAVVVESARRADRAGEVANPLRAEAGDVRNGTCTSLERLTP